MHFAECHEQRLIRAAVRSFVQAHLAFLKAQKDGADHLVRIAPHTLRERH